MAKVAIQKHPGVTEPVWSLLEDLREHFVAIKNRAFSLFKERGGEHGRDLDDWLRAERERFEVPSSELTEDDNAIHVRAAVPGLKATDIEITATPCELAIRGHTSRRKESKKGESSFTEFSERQMFRRFALPAEVDVDNVSAKVEDGMLTIEMPKRAPAKKVNVERAAA